MGDQTTQGGSSDAHLLELLRAGDARALDVIAERHQPALLRFCTSYLGEVGRAEDVVQETLSKLAEPSACPEGELRPWLFRVARNRCLDLLRRQQRSPTHGPPLKSTIAAATETAGPRTRLAREERRELVRQIIAGMPEDYRSVLTLKYFSGLSRGEIAETLEITEAAVKGRLVRASEYLYEQIRHFTWAEP